MICLNDRLVKVIIPTKIWIFERNNKSERSSLYYLGGALSRGFATLKPGFH